MASAARGHRLEAQRECGAAGHRALYVRHHRPRDRARSDDRVSPIVELDELGHQVGAHTVAIALDAIDAERDGVAHDAAITAPATLQRRWYVCSSNSFAKTRSAEPSMPAAPSGWRHAP